MNSSYQTIALKNEAQKSSIVLKDTTSSIPTKKNQPKITPAEQNRQRILEVVNNLTEDELEKISEMLKQTEEPQKENEDQPEVTISKDDAEATKDTKGPEVEDGVSKVSRKTKDTMISSLVTQLDEER